MFVCVCVVQSMPCPLAGRVSLPAFETARKEAARAAAQVQIRPGKSAIAASHNEPRSAVGTAKTKSSARELGLLPRLVLTTWMTLRRKWQLRQNPQRSLCSMCVTPPHSTLNCHTTMLRRLLQSQDLQINAYTRVCATIGCCDCLPRQGDDCHREDTCYDSNFTIGLNGCE